jgi:hypothetical protein
MYRNAQQGLALDSDSDPLIILETNHLYYSFTKHQRACICLVPTTERFADHGFPVTRTRLRRVLAYGAPNTAAYESS